MLSSSVQSLKHFVGGARSTETHLRVFDAIQASSETGFEGSVKAVPDIGILKG